MINDTAWSSCSPPGCLWLETNMCHYWWDYEWLNSQDLNKHRNISFQKKRAFSVRETRADFSALLVSHVTPPSSQSSSGKRWWWKTGLGSAGFCAGKGHSMVEKRDDRTMTEQWEQYPTDMTYIKVIILVFTHIYIYTKPVFEPLCHAAGFATTCRRWEHCKARDTLSWQWWSAVTKLYKPWVPCLTPQMASQKSPMLISEINKQPPSSSSSHCRHQSMIRMRQGPNGQPQTLCEDTERNQGLRSGLVQCDAKRQIESILKVKLGLLQPKKLRVPTFRPLPTQGPIFKTESFWRFWRISAAYNGHTTGLTLSVVQNRHGNPVPRSTHTPRSPARKTRRSSPHDFRPPKDVRKIIWVRKLVDLDDFDWFSLIFHKILQKSVGRGCPILIHAPHVKLPEKYEVENPKNCDFHKLNLQ